MSVRAVDWAINDVRGIKPTTRLVLTKLADHANDDGISWVGKYNMSEALEISKRSIDAHIEILVSMGLITVTQRKVHGGKNLTNIYQLHLGQLGLIEGAKPAGVQYLHPCKKGPFRGASRGAEKPEKTPNSAPESFKPTSITKEASKKEAGKDQKKHDMEWFETWTGIQEYGSGHYGILHIEFNEPVAYVTELIRRMEAADHDIPDKLRRYLERIKAA